MLGAFLIGLIFQTAQIELGGVPLTVEVADTYKKREQGLMEREALEEGHGMLFIYDEEAILSLWMKNTRIPLSAAFFNEKRVLLNIVDMDPPRKGVRKLPSFESVSPAKYALEVPQGWFKKNKIGPGTTFNFESP